MCGAPEQPQLREREHFRARARKRNGVECFEALNLKEDD